MPPKKGGTFKFVSISVVGLCNGASWCERAADLLAAKFLVIARAPISAESLTLVAGLGLVFGAEVNLLARATSRLYPPPHPPKHPPPHTLPLSSAKLDLPYP